MRSLKVHNVIDLKPCLLLVDDEVFNLEILEELLDDYGYQTDSAENGRQACDLLSANPDKYQAVLLDRMMPEMGYTTQNATTDKPQGVNLPEFKTQEPFFVRWSTPMVEAGGLWIATQLKGGEIRPDDGVRRVQVGAAEVVAHVAGDERGDGHVAPEEEARGPHGGGAA